MNDGELLELIGKALFGENYREPLRTLLGVNERSLRRWTAFEAPVPNGLWSDLIDQLKLRQSQMVELIIIAEGRLGRVDVYSFDYWDHHLGKNERSHGKSTLARIERIGARADHSTRETVHRSEVDGEGRLLRLIERPSVVGGFQTHVGQPRSGKLE